MLARQLRRATRVVIVIAVDAIDPGNGDVLALVSKPGFDPAAFARGLSRAEYAQLSDDIDKPLFNRALRGTYPSGSLLPSSARLAAVHSVSRATALHALEVLTKSGHARHVESKPHQVI